MTKLQNVLLGFALLLPITSIASISGVVCNGGDLVIEEDTKSGRYTATVYDNEAIRYLVDQSYQEGPGVCVGECQGMVQIVEKVFPRNVQVYYTQGGSMMEIKGLRTKNGGRSFRSVSAIRNGPRVRRTQEGYKLILSGQTLTENMEEVFYTIGEWHFSNCALH